MGDLVTNIIVDECKAAVLLGLPVPELLWFSRMLGVGHKERNGNSSLWVFTYDELKRLAFEASTSAK